eukprot:TRINITY_DN18550_c0_g1_i1.p1 TRINITY_DN18550_c0_g1~~TRINITY_DN18550_c0_g1_i1.p1  ORF type:complete len:408 (-),score=63.95 TRINITY_DN18550_c0_g1_i1:286-1326(-)
MELGRRRSLDGGFWAEVPPMLPVPRRRRLSSPRLCERQASRASPFPRARRRERAHRRVPSCGLGAWLHAPLGLAAAACSWLLGSVGATPLCGSFSRWRIVDDKIYRTKYRYEECQNIGGVQAGLGLWVATEYIFDGNYRFKRVERGSMTERDCQERRYWLELTYTGTWKLEDGKSPAASWYRRAQTSTTAAVVKLLTNEVCFDNQVLSNQQRCVNAAEAVKRICPCNGWEWKVEDGFRERNVGMLCQPQAQCPIVNVALLQQTQYFAYNGTDDGKGACFSKSSREKSVAWDKPEDQACYKRIDLNSCLGISGAASLRRSAAASALRWTLLFALAALLALSSDSLRA